MFQARRLPGNGLGRASNLITSSEAEANRETRRFGLRLTCPVQKCIPTDTATARLKKSYWPSAVCPVVEGALHRFIHAAPVMRANNERSTGRENKSNIFRAKDKTNAWT